MIFLPEWLFMDWNAFPVGKRIFKFEIFKGFLWRKNYLLYKKASKSQSVSTLYIAVSRRETMW